MKMRQKNIYKILVWTGALLASVPFIILSNLKGIPSANGSKIEQTEKYIIENVQHRSILDFDPSYATIQSKEFYSNPVIRDELLNQLRNNKVFLLGSNSNDSIIDLAIDVDGDNDPIYYGGLKKTKFDEKNINGELALRLTTKDAQQNVSVTKIIIHGFLRNHPFIFIDEATDNPGFKIYKALNQKMHIEIKNSYDAEQYLINNIYFYSNYNDPIKSKFININKSWINIVGENSYNVSNYEFPNSMVFDKNGTTISTPLLGNITFNIVRSIYNKTTIIALSLTAAFSIGIVLLLVLFYFVRGYKLKNVK